MASNPKLVRGYQINCLNYSQCPICYGCRNYSALDPECRICEIDACTNICDTKKHRSDLVSRMITHTKIDLHKMYNDEVSFKNFDD